MNLLLKIAFSLVLWSIASGLFGIGALFLEDEKKRNYSFLAVVSQYGSGLAAAAIAIIWGFIEIWS